MYEFRAYTGIGARNTPGEILEAFETVAGYLAAEDWTLRSGAADGADAAFETGCERSNGRREIYLPWPWFNSNPSPFNNPSVLAHQLAAEFHPKWYELSNGSKKLMARNAQQLMGFFVERPVFSKFILCWTPKGAVTGGTGQALRMADHYNIPVINLGSCSLEDAEEKILEINEKTKHP